MKAEDINTFMKTTPILEVGGYIKCPYCGEWSIHSKWQGGEVYFAPGETDFGLKCPNCEEYSDCIFTELETKRIYEFT